MFRNTLAIGEEDVLGLRGPDTRRALQYRRPNCRGSMGPTTSTTAPDTRQKCQRRSYHTVVSVGHAVACAVYSYLLSRCEAPCQPPFSHGSIASESHRDAPRWSLPPLKQGDAAGRSAAGIAPHGMPPWDAPHGARTELFPQFDTMAGLTKLHTPPPWHAGSSTPSPADAARSNVTAPSCQWEPGPRRRRRPPEQTRLCGSAATCAK